MLLLSKSTPEQSFSSFMGKGIIPLSPQYIFNSLRNPQLRFMYDNMLKVGDAHPVHANYYSCCSRNCILFAILRRACLFVSCCGCAVAWHDMILQYTFTMRPPNVSSSKQGISVFWSVSVLR